MIPEDPSMMLLCVSTPCQKSFWIIIPLFLWRRKAFWAPLSASINGLGVVFLSHGPILPYRDRFGNILIDSVVPELPLGVEMINPCISFFWEYHNCQKVQYA